MTALDFGFARALPAFGSVTTPNNTSHSIAISSADIPIVAGQLLFLFVAVDGAPTITWPSGWTSLVDATDAGSNVKLSVRWRIADGGEATPLTLTTSSTQELAARLVVFEAHGASTYPPEAATATGSSATPDYPSLTASWGSDKNVWIAVHAADGVALSATPHPTGYPFGTNAASSADAGNGCVLTIARKQVTAATENPGAGAIGGVNEWVAATIAVYPGTEGTVTVPRVVDVVTTATASGTSHVLTLPAYAVGDLLVVAFGTDDVPTFTWPVTLTQLIADTAAAANAKIGVRYRVADGTEGSTVTVTTSASEEGTGIIAAVRGHDPARPPTGSVTTGSGQVMTGVNVTAGSVGSRLWLGGGIGNGPVLFAEWHNMFQEQVASLQSSASAANACTQLMGYRNRNADAQGIVSMRMTASTQWAAWSAVIYPGSIVVPPGTVAPGRTRAHPHFYRPNVHYIPRRIRH